MPQRAQAAAALAAQLGATLWAAAEMRSEDDSLSLVHRPTGIEFVAVPGGDFEMGLSEADIEDASEYIDWISPVAAWVQALANHARPVRRVHVEPFVVARRPLAKEEAERLGTSGSGEPVFTREDARHFARAHGFRLPSDAEFEWLARDARACPFLLDAACLFPRRRHAELRSRFGLRDLSRPHWVEDDWHANYEGAPSDAAPWMNGGSQGVRRSGFVLEDMQDAQELLEALAALRREGDDMPCIARFAAALP